MNFERGLFLVFAVGRINSILWIKNLKISTNDKKTNTNQLILFSALTVATTFLFANSGYAYTSTEAKKEVDININQSSFSSDHANIKFRFITTKTSTDIVQNSKPKIAQSSNIIDFIPPFFKGFANNKPQQTAKPLPSDKKTHQDKSVVKKKSANPKTVRSFKRPARAFCVRLCDGYYWPVEENVLKIMAKSTTEYCSSQCTSPTKVFLNHKPGSTAEHLIDKSGKRYKDLENSFLYRKKYIPSCRCRPNPWDSAEQKRHVKYEQTNRDVLNVNANNQLDTNQISTQLDATSSAGWSVEVSRSH